jgi:DNA-binding transcriptional LysR family regulator
MDPHLLRTFVTVVRLGSFSAAATELGYTQAAVSQQVATLESDLKITLLTRRPVTPTEAGARLLEHADPILLRLDAARADIARLASAPQGRLKVGLTPLVGARVGVALAALRQRMPRLDVTVRVCSQFSVTTGVARGEFDIGLVDGLAAPGDSLSLLAPLTGVGVTESEVALVLSAGHPLASRASVRLADLVDARWIDAPELSPLSDIRRVAGTDGFRATLRYEGTDTLTLIALATAGHGLTLLPAWAATAGESVSIRVGDPPLVHRVEQIHGTLRKASPAAKLAGLLR